MLPIPPLGFTPYSFRKKVVGPYQFMSFDMGRIVYRHEQLQGRGVLNIEDSIPQPVCCI